MTDSESSAERKGRLPPWLRKRMTLTADVAQVRGMLADLGLATVCSSAHCPNIGECFARHTATFLIMGNTCTRDCRFCAIRAADPGPLRDDEPDAVAEACHRLALRHVVITSVTRDDLPDGGASHVAHTIHAVRRRLPNTIIEVLTPDFQGNTDAIDTVLAAQPAIFNHNVETVPRLYAQVRPQADYTQSLAVLAYAKRKATQQGLTLHTKSGIMVGLGETDDEVKQVMSDLRNAACDMLTIGQYLAPSPEHTPVVRYIEPAEFDAWHATARQMGFAAVAAGPFVRSSYHADDMFESSTQNH